MGFRINSNVAAMNAHQIGVSNNRSLNNSLEKLSSGLRINKAADDASGMAIADGLRSQANALGQAIKNANDGVGIIQVADKAMDEQIKILDTIKVKATQAAQDGQTEATRKMIQQDITKLMEELDNIASTTSFNGQSLLSGSFTNKEFQIGAYSNETIKTSIGPTSSDKIGSTRYETGLIITAAHTSAMKFLSVDGLADVQLEGVTISTSAGTGLGVLTETINKNSGKLGVHASWKVITTGQEAVKSGTIKNLEINGINIGTMMEVAANDSDAKLIAAINSLSDKHGVEASIDERGKLSLRSLDGRGIKVTSDGVVDQGTVSGGGSSSTGLGAILGLAGTGVNGEVAENYGRLTLTRLGGRDIRISGTNAQITGFDNENEAQSTINLRNVRAGFNVDQASAMGMFGNFNINIHQSARQEADGLGTSYKGMAGIGSGVTTLQGAMATMDIAESAMKMLDKVRSDLGSTQNQLVATINNISVTQVNVKAAESQIRDVDFAEESANFQKHNILAQSGSYAMSQANAVQQNVMKLLQ